MPRASALARLGPLEMEASPLTSVIRQARGVGEPARAHAAMLHHVDQVEASFEKLLAEAAAVSARPWRTPGCQGTPSGMDS